MAVRIIVDSSVDMRPELKSQCEVIPLTISFGEEEYLDGIDINSEMFYEKLITSDLLPKTSQAPPSAFYECYEKLVSEGDQAVVITIASTLSGTCQSAMIAAEAFPDSIFVVDSYTATIASGILAEHALVLRDQGMAAPEIAQTLEKEKGDIRIIALLDTLEYLKKGGRISAATAWAGGLLSIKPVICVEDGEVKILGKARGSKQGNNLPVQHIDKAGGVDFDRPVLLAYSGMEDDLLKKYIEHSRFLWEGQEDKLSSIPICSVVGTHVGPGAIAAAFFKK